MLEQLRHQAAVRLGIPRLDAVVVALSLRSRRPLTFAFHPLGVAGFSPGALRAAAAPARTVRRLPRHADLHANIAIALRLIPPDALLDRFERAAAGMPIHIDAAPAFA